MSNSQYQWNKGWQDAQQNKPAETKPTQSWQEKQSQRAGHSFGEKQQSTTSKR
jgi:hypothetical protein